MTCIVGLVHGKNVSIGGDSAGVGGRWDLSVRKNRKVFRNGKYVIGSSGSPRVGQLLNHSFKAPEPPKKSAELMPFMVTTFVDALRECFKNTGCARNDYEQDKFDASFLVGVNGRLFQIEADYQVGESALRFDAVGCGDMIALGAMHAMGEDYSPRQRILKALAISERWCAGVRGPFHVVTV